MNFNFDWNEWYFILSSILILCLFLLIRKYFKLVTVVIIWVYNITLVSSIDYFFIATPYEMYYFGDNPTYEFSGALFHLFMYPCASLLFLYFYDKWDMKKTKLIFYIAAWTVFAVFYEWVTVQNHALTYTNWKLYYSIPTYPISSVMLILLYRFIKREIEKNEPI